MYYILLVKTLRRFTVLEALVSYKFIEFKSFIYINDEKEER